MPCAFLYTESYLLLFVIPVNKRRHTWDGRLLCCRWGATLSRLSLRSVVAYSLSCVFVLNREVITTVQLDDERLSSADADANGLRGNSSRLQATVTPPDALRRVSSCCSFCGARWWLLSVSYSLSRSQIQAQVRRQKREKETDWMRD